MIALRVKASQSDWKNLIFPKKFVSIDYSRSFSEEEYEKISYGLIPREMEDKWMIYLKSDVLYLHRSWTGFCLYKVTFRADEGSHRVVEALVNASEDQIPAFNPKYHVQLFDFLISNLLLNESKPFPMPKQLGIGPTGLFQHHITGTYFPEKLLDEDD